VKTRHALPGFIRWPAETKQSERAANGAPRCGAGWPLPMARDGARVRAATGVRAGGRANSVDLTK
jgi:hypothetical protein